MAATRSNAEALGKMNDGIGQIVAAPGNALIELMTFGSPVDRIKQDTRQGLTDILYTPFRMAKDTAWGLAKVSAKLLWAGIKNLPIFPVWNKEREQTKTDARSDLSALAQSPNLQGRTSPYESELGIAA